MARVLIVEDDKNTLSGLTEILGEEGYDVVGVEGGQKALQLLEGEDFDILLTDLKMPDISGMELYERSKAYAPEMKTIVMTAYSSVKDAVEAMKKGVYEYLTKPLNLDELLLTLRKAVQETALVQENVELKDRIKTAYRFADMTMIAKSKAMHELFQTITKVARSNSTVLIRGESGTGKDLVAHAIHYKSPRADQPFVQISCASFPETLLESELFGYEKGAFTGAETRKKGRFELADGGTLFLDEIGDISESVQTKLLRVLEEKKISRLGSTESIKVDVRLITATNRDLERAMETGRFREDLYYRLNVIPIFIPPLRERKEDIPLLSDYFLKRFAADNGKPDLRFSDEALELCLAYDWPGNVRELENAIQNAVVLGEGDVILPEHLPLTIHKKAKPIFVSDSLSSNGVSYQERMDSLERQILIEAIRRAGGNKAAAARRLGISLRTMRYKVKKYGL